MRNVGIIILCIVFLAGLVVAENCTDSDSGLDYNTKGNITEAGVIVAEDSCINGSFLLENYCENDSSMSVEYECPQVCTQGRCDASGGPQQYECGDGKCENGELTPTHPEYCPEDCIIDCDVEWEGYEYNNASNKCEFATTSGCDNPNYHETKEECEEANNITNVTECEWECTQWSACENGIQTRTCTNPDDCTEDEPKTEKTCRVKEQIKEAIQERNRIHFEERTGQECTEGCVCTGRIMKCQTETGREMTVYAGSGNIIVQVKRVNMTTTVTLYHHNKTLYGNFSGEEKPIILPDQIPAKIKAKIKAKLGEEESEMEIELNENGYYEVQTKKRARLFWIIPVKEKIRAQIEAEYGDIKIRNPWWGFLANDVDSE
ncbi:MAG: hypothetical protein KKB31_03670 [Nanoarchaeota archaeon]|nr:hypothetical protein [Nanoarchaeota archaeon]